MSSQGRPSIDMFHMIKHDPTYLKVTSKLHPLASPYMDILKRNIFSLEWHVKKKKIMQESNESM